MKFSREHLGVPIHLDCFHRQAVVQRRSMMASDFLLNVVLGIGKQYYSRDPEVSHNFTALTLLSFRHETE